MKLPCNTITNVSLELKNANLDWLKKAIEGLGYLVQQDGQYLRWRTGDYSGNTGKLEVRDEEEGARIKRAYSEQVVKNSAGRFGWQVKKVSENKYQVVKGR